MKKIKNISRYLLIPGLVMALSLSLTAQGPPPPPENGHGSFGNQPANGGNAPIGSGIAILLSMGAAWGGKKVYQAFKDRDRLI